MQPPVLFAIVEIRPHAIADYKPKIFVNRYITRVEYTMNVTTQENAV